MELVYLDIETVPIKIEDEAIKEYLMDIRIGKNKRVFDPNYCRIILIGLKNNNETKLFNSQDEKKLLTDFWDFIKELANKKGPFNLYFVTHNGYSFDIPFIKLRSIINNLDIPINIETNKNKNEDANSNHFDVMLFFSNYGNFTNLNLDILAKLNKIEFERTEFTGADIEKSYKKREFEKIELHCKEDLDLLQKIFEKLCLNYLKRKKVIKD